MRNVYIWKQGASWILQEPSGLQYNYNNLGEVFEVLDRFELQFDQIKWHHPMYVNPS